MLLSIQEIFPALDIAVMQSIYTNKFQPANLRKLETSFTYKKNHPQFYSFGTGEASLNLSTTCKDVDLEEYESISHLMRPFTVYAVIICTFAPPPQKLPLAFAIMTYVHTLYTHLRQPHLTPGFAKPRSFWGGAGYYFGLTIFLCLCPLAFASVSHRFKALFTTQHQRQPVASATTLVSVRNTRVFRTALTALTEPRTL